MGYLIHLQLMENKLSFLELLPSSSTRGPPASLEFLFGCSSTSTINDYHPHVLIACHGIWSSSLISGYFWVNFFLWFWCFGVLVVGLIIKYWFKGIYYGVHGKPFLVFEGCWRVKNFWNLYLVFPTRSAFGVSTSIG